MGIVDLFVPGVANLTAFDRFANLNVDEAIHQATVEVTEEGTVATAATGQYAGRKGKEKERNRGGGGEREGEEWQRNGGREQGKATEGKEEEKGWGGRKGKRRKRKRKEK